MKIKKIVTLFVALCLMPSFVSAKTIILDFTKRTQKNALVRSILLPGWGQFYKGSNTKGYIISAGAFLSASLAYYYLSESDKAYEKYRKISLIDDDSYSDYQNKSNKFNIAVLSLTLFWLYGIVDTYFISSGEEYAQNEKNWKFCRKDGVKLACGGRKIELSFTKTF
ncbi:MAG: DUF5683 domain-containing protein [Elusimicrobia bacterium]|nr:DUF5683 domain-containing protein [Elusimicrobiota bacterium]